MFRGDHGLASSSTFSPKRKIWGSQLHGHNRENAKLIQFGEADLTWWSQVTEAVAARSGVQEQAAALYCAAHQTPPC